MAEQASKKRKRDITDVDVDLVRIYDKLASEDERSRLHAASQLVTKTLSTSATNEDQIITVLKRLFRGLCSSRKAARLGFAVALTEFLAQLQSPEHTTTVSPSKIVGIFDTTTTPEGGSRGQDERDYYLGRVFGADAIIKSRILFATQERSQWKRLLSLLCAVAIKKPWLRQECGWILSHLAGDGSEGLKPFVGDVIEALTAEKLIRTPEGVAIWLTAKKSYPDSKLSKHAWKHSHPLAAKDVQGLAEVMKNARSQQPDAEFGAQGSTSWTASLHFAWTIVLRHFFEQPGPSDGVKNHGKDSHELVTFEQFWEVVVDNGLFSIGSSTERKLWGVLLFSQVASAAPVVLLPAILREKTLHCMITSLNGDDRYLRKSTQSALQTLVKRFKSTQWSQDPQASAECLRYITRATNFLDFDSATKSRVVAALLEAGRSRQLLSELRLLQKGLSEDGDRTKKLRFLINLESKLLASCLRNAEKESEGESIAAEILTTWLLDVHSQPESVQQYLRDRTSAALEQALKAGPAGRRVFKAALSLENLKTSTSDEAIDKILRKAEKRLRKLDKAARKQTSGDIEASEELKKSTPTSLIEGFQLLYCLVAYDIYNGEQESVEIMQDLLDIDVPTSSQETQSTDPLVEILLSFSSRPSKFLRTLTPIIFESLASGLTGEGLQSLTRVLAAKESAQGQQEMFEAADEEMNDSIGSEDDEDEEKSGEELDSDVEVVDASEADEPDDSETDDDGSSEGSEPQDGDDELAAFDAALASALGTSRGDDESDSDSDADMDDDEMMELDEKLTEVFKARKEATSKKKDQKDAKENVVNFKNRVLDLIEVYIKHEYRNPHAIELVLPLLQTIRTTQTKQIAERSSKALRDLCSRCKGQQNPPSVEQGAVKQVMALFNNIHTEACMDASNSHAAAASQASILLAKVVIKSGVAVGKVVQLYAQTMTLMMTDPKCKVHSSFFTDWNNWCTSARSWTVQQEGKQE